MMEPVHPSGRCCLFAAVDGMHALGPFHPIFKTRFYLVPEDRIGLLGLTPEDLDIWTRVGFTTRGRTSAEAERIRAILLAFERADWVIKSEDSETGSSLAFLAPEGAVITRVLAMLPNAVESQWQDAGMSPAPTL